MIEDTLSSGLFNFTFEYAFRKARTNQEGLKFYVRPAYVCMPMMLLFWVEAYIVQTKYGSFSSQRFGLEATAIKLSDSIWSWLETRLLENFPL